VTLHMRSNFALLILVLFTLPTGCRWAGSYTVTEQTFTDAGEAYLKKDWLGAYTLFRRCRRMDVHKEDAEYHEALCLVELGRFEKARSRLRELRDDVDGNQWSQRIDLAMARAREDNPDRAERLYLQMQDHAGGAYREQVMAAYAGFRARIGDSAGAGEIRRRLARMYPSTSFLPEKPSRYAVQAPVMYRSREEADGVRSRALKAGFDSVVLTSCAPGSSPLYLVQYGSFYQQDGAKKLVYGLRKNGIEGIIR